MSDELNDLSAPAETGNVSAGGGVNTAPDVAAPVAAAPAEETITESTTIDKNPDVATALNIEANNDPRTQAAQTAQLELNGSPLADGQGGEVSQVARNREEDKEAEKKDRAFDAIERQQEAAARHHKEFMERDHDFGGMKINGGDLEKLMNFYANNPQMRDKIAEKLRTSGMSDSKVSKAQKEMDEYIKLKEKEKQVGVNGLTPEEQQRLREINKSEEFRKIAAESVNLANENNLQINVKAENSFNEYRKEIASEFGSSVSAIRESRQAPVAASARDELPPTLVLTTVYNDTNAKQIAAANQPEIQVKQDIAAITTGTRVDASIQALM